MAAMSAAQLLDELMGRDRNLGPQEKRPDINWSDSQVCKHFLVSFCPHELFVNTKADLGPCDKLHDERIRDAYRKSTRFEAMGYEEEFIRFSQSMITDVERRIKRGRQRLSLTQQENAAAKPNIAKDNEEKISMLSDKINSLLEQVESLGCEGKVEEAQGVMKLCDQLKEDRETLRKGSDPSQNEYNNVVEKQMEVCEVCGAFLIVGDAQQRLDDHLMGKQHCGYAMLRTTLDDVMNKVQQKKDVKEKQRETDREERRKKREQEDNKGHEFVKVDDRRKRNSRDDYRRRKSRSKSRDRRSKYNEYRDRDRKGSDRDRRGGVRSRSRDYRRSRSRSLDRRNKSREWKRSRSRDKHRRSRSRDKPRRSRSRSRDYKKRSKSKDRSMRSRSNSKPKDWNRSSLSRDRSDGNCDLEESGATHTDSKLMENGKNESKKDASS